MDFLIIDGNCLAFNVFYGINKKNKSKPVSLEEKQKIAKKGTYKFAEYMRWLISTYNPNHVAVIVDRGGETFRDKLFPKYKSQRESLPDEYYLMMSQIEKSMNDYGIKCFGVENYEADDIIGSIARKFQIETLIVTGDKDLYQLVNEKTKILNVANGVRDAKLIDEKTVKKVMGVWPRQIADYKALAGDKSDHYGGLPGIGHEGAVYILNKYGNVKTAYRQAETVDKMYRKNFIRGEEKYNLSIQLSTIVTNVPIPFKLKHFVIDNEDKNIKKVIKQLGY